MTITTPAEQTAQAPQFDVPQGAALMTLALGELVRLGYRRCAVDTLVDIDGGSIRHHYAGREWSLTRIRPGSPNTTVSWDVWHPLPTVEWIIGQATS